ncbi:MAG: hypothetical protein ABIN89_08470 [Chitinophagaceae bacterium]
MILFAMVISFKQDRKLNKKEEEIKDFFLLENFKTIITEVFYFYRNLLPARFRFIGYRLSAIRYQLSGGNISRIELLITDG